jgi:hypothetical protein
MRAILAAVFLSAAFPSVSFADSPLGLSRKDALFIAEKTAKEHGANLKRYELAAFPQGLSEDGKEWTFYFVCTPEPTPPGCHFWVSVNRVSGAAKYLPGE